MSSAQLVLAADLAIAHHGCLALARAEMVVGAPVLPRYICCYTLTAWPKWMGDDRFPLNGYPHCLIDHLDQCLWYLLKNSLANSTPETFSW